MRKTWLFATISLLVTQTFAQSLKSELLLGASIESTREKETSVVPVAKPTGLSDTLNYGTNAQVNGPSVSYLLDRSSPADSGLLHGMNALGDKSFAHLYYSIDATQPQDTTYNIIGILSRWTGRVSASSTRTLTLNVWKSGTQKIALAGRNNVYVYGLPTTSPIASETVSFSAIPTGGSAFIKYFSIPVTGINFDVYVGYSLPNYMWNGANGDTIGVRSTRDTSAAKNYYTIETGTGDTLVRPNVIVQNASNTWFSQLYNRGMNGGDLNLMPVIQLSTNPTTIRGVGNGELTALSGYPVPTADRFNIRFSLKENGIKVILNVYDASGRRVETISKQNLGQGENSIPIETSNLPNGNYIYTLETQKGGVIASQFVVLR